ncbi:hypothetical protein H6P81_015656 [Aristolochia fimbriata]|uniref:isochorismate synthase n=1 Tax=Aristolochia fimbriata TaxID=158543 RepID=A0AAV7E962_ARIFI|nr:hypothetical protein H6P81_015656 [Aristolochia fimbriata]
MALAYKISHLSTKTPGFAELRFSQAQNPVHLSLRNINVKCLAMSINGCGGDPNLPLGLCEIKTLPAVSAPSLAVDELRSAISELKSNPPELSSGVIRLEVPIEQQVDAVGWLYAQHVLPRCFFSGRSENARSYFFPNGISRQCPNGTPPNLLRVSGVGSAVFFQQFHPFTLDDWRCIKRFLSKECPLIRAYGALRFDASTDISSEWEGFGSFYFVIPQVELNEFEGASVLASTIAWDNSLLWTWENAVSSLEATVHQISSNVRLEKDFTRAKLISQVHMPTKTSWDAAVKKALDMIKKQSSGMVKVVLARSTRVVPSTDIDPVALLACLQDEGQNAYQFCLQPPAAPAFIGNTPEQLFHRRYLDISSEALAGTRARGRSESLDLQIEEELLKSSKDHLEFTIVRESIRRKLEVLCDQVIIEPKKAIRKLPRVQHLYAQFSGRLRNEDDEFGILSSLHPSPAVCGLPAEEARTFIAETEMFDRGMYAGPVGWFGGGESEFAVGIRSALVKKGLGMIVYAGAGIVEGTDPSSEWEELELKASQFIKLIEQEQPLSCYNQNGTISGSDRPSVLSGFTE